MSNLTDAISALGTRFSGAFTSASVLYEQPSVIDNNTALPLFVINIIRLSQDDFASSTLSSLTLQVLFYARTLNDKLLFSAITEKVALNKSIKDAIKAWHLNISNSIPGIGALTNIETGYIETLQNGEYGSLDKNTIRLALQFTITIKEL